MAVDPSIFIFLAYEKFVLGLGQAISTEKFPAISIKSKNIENFEANKRNAKIFLSQMQYMLESKDLKRHKLLPLFVVGFYYSMYFALTARLLAKGLESNQLKSHKGVINAATHICKTEPDFWGYPYNITYDGKKFTNLPHLLISPKVEKHDFKNFSIPDHMKKEIEESETPFPNFVQYSPLPALLDLDDILTFMRTTHQKEKKKGTPLTVSLFHCLYRLRIRLNYKGSGDFILSSANPSNEMESRFSGFCDALWKIAIDFAKH